MTPLVYAAVFSDGQVGSTMETASDFSAWTGNTTGGTGTATVSLTAPHHGSNSYKMYIPAHFDVSYIYKNIVQASVKNIRLYVKFTAWDLADADELPLIHTRWEGAMNFAQVGVCDSTHNLYLKVEDNGAAFAIDKSATTLSLNTDYSIELEVTIVDATHFTWKVYLDGVEVADLTVTNRLFTWADDLFDRVYVGNRDYVNTPIATGYLDCFVFDNAYIGVEAGNLNLFFDLAENIYPSGAGYFQRSLGFQLSETAYYFTTHLLGKELLFKPTETIRFLESATLPIGVLTIDIAVAIGVLALVLSITGLGKVFLRRRRD